MFGKRFVTDLMVRSAENDLDRRRFLQSASAAGLGVVGAATLGAAAANASPAARPKAKPEAESEAPSDGAILNFALNLEYLEAEYYHHAAYGTGLKSTMTTGTGKHGKVTGGRKVKFDTNIARGLANTIAADETEHVAFLRGALGSSRVALPSIDIKSSFTAAARAAGLVGKNEEFDPYANEDNFLLGAFIFEDVGVTAYKGAAPLISNKAYLEAAAGILSVEAYHAGAIRAVLYEKGLSDAVRAISNARDSLDNKRDDDRGVKQNGKFLLAPTNRYAQAFSRSPGDVLNVVYLNPGTATKGGFFPNGVNGSTTTSTAS